MTKWFRSWHGAPTDPKWLLIGKKSGVSPAIVSSIVWALFDYASQEEDRGSVVGFDIETYAVWADIPEEDVANVINALTEKQIIVDGRLAAWEKRQPKREDDSSERVRAYRERVAREQAENAEGCNAPETPSNADVTQCNADVTQRNAPEERRGDTEKTNKTLAAKPPRESEAEPKPAKRASKSQPRDLIWDALVAKCGEPETKSERGDYNRTVKELRQARASPDEMAAFPDWWRRSYPNAKLTHRCYRAHWGQYLASGKLQSTPQLDSYENWSDPEVFERLTT